MPRSTPSYKSPSAAQPVDAGDASLDGKTTSTAKQVHEAYMRLMRAGRISPTNQELRRQRRQRAIEQRRSAK